MSEQQEQQPEAGGERAPTVIVFAGPNGSGKSTTTARVLDDPELKFDGEYINADDIAKGLEGAIADPQARNLKAAQIAEERRHTALKEGRAFAFETVMSTPGKVALLTEAKAKGYEVTLAFVTTSDPAINVQRVADRVLKGGHDVPADKIASRYHSAMNLLACAVEHADTALIVDNSGTKPRDVAYLIDAQLIEADPSQSPAWVAEKLIKPHQERTQSREQMHAAFLQLQDGQEMKIADADASHGKSYTGKIIEATKHHALQQVGANKCVVHDLALTAPLQLEKGKSATIGYAYQGGKIIEPTKGMKHAPNVPLSSKELGHGPKR